MSRLIHLKLVVRHRFTHKKRTGYLLSAASKERFNIFWQDNAGRVSTLETKSWQALELSGIFADGNFFHVTFGIYDRDQDGAWRRVHTEVLRKSWQDANAKEEGEPVEHYPLGWAQWEDDDAWENIYASRKGYYSSHNKPVEDKRKPLGWHRQCEYYHQSMKDILEEYHNPYNAVIIFPGSPLDIKLQEAYNARRSQSEEPAND